MPAAVRHWTPDDVRALPDDGNRYECIDGVLIVSPSPRMAHQRCLEAFHWRLGEYVRSHAFGELLTSPADIEIVPGHLVQPDLFVFARTPHGRVKDWTQIKGLLLAVEVLSPSTARYDRGIKRKFYTSSPTEEYWIVDADSRTVERWRRGDERPEVLVDELVWHPFGAPVATRIELPKLFAAVHEE